MILYREVAVCSLAARDASAVPGRIKIDKAPQKLYNNYVMKNAPAGDKCESPKMRPRSGYRMTGPTRKLILKRSCSIYE